MKIRIKGNSVRLRLTKSEVDKIALGQSVKEIVEFPENELTYKISFANHSVVSFRDGFIHIEIEKSGLSKWASSTEVGIDFTSGKLQVLVEKDFACLITRDGEDDADAFPNPLASDAG